MRLVVASPVHVGRLRSRDGTLEILAWGDGSHRRLLAVHGFLDHGWSWDGLVPAIADAIDLVSFSARGHGGSDRADAYQWVDFVADLLAVIEVVAEEGPIDLLGHSWGAHLCHEAALLAPHLVRRVVNVDGIEANHSASASPDLLERTRQAAARPAPDLRPGFPSIDDLAARRQELTPRVPAEVARSFAERGSVRIDGRWHWALDPLLVTRTLPWDARGARPLDLGRALAESPVDVLVVTGGVTETRHLTPRRDAAWEAARLPHVRHLHVADAGHYVHLERPALVAAALLEFLS